MINIIAAEKVPPLNAPLILSVDVLLASSFTINIPAIEQSNPTDARASGKNISDCLGPRTSIIDKLIVEAIAIDAIIEPQ